MQPDDRGATNIFFVEKMVWKKKTKILSLNFLKLQEMGFGR